MPGIKEIRTKIKSVQNTRKITKAMEMVAASKMRRAQERMRAARPYADKVREIAAHMSRANPEYRHPFMTENGEAKTAGLIQRVEDTKELSKDDEAELTAAVQDFKKHGAF